MGIILVFWVLAAQYESYLDPVIILFAVPLAVFGALLAQTIRGLPNDIYCQIGLVMLVATFLSLFVVPILYIIIKQLADGSDSRSHLDKDATLQNGVRRRLPTKASDRADFS